jgi:hypothetical protein
VKHGANLETQLLYKTEYEIKSDIIGFIMSFRLIVVLVYWPKLASDRSNQTIKAIDLACELFVRRFVSPDVLSGRWDSGDESYLYLRILFTNLKKGRFFTHRSRSVERGPPRKEPKIDTIDDFASRQNVQHLTPSPTPTVSSAVTHKIPLSGTECYLFLRKPPR